MKNKIIIVGKGGSGKDYLRKILEKNFDMRYCILHTSRPIRNGEIDGVDYYFVDRKFFEKNIKDFYEYTEFNNWFYGISLNEFRNSQLFIMTPNKIDTLNTIDRENSLIIYLDIDEQIRRSRLDTRNDKDNTERRISADYKDFYRFYNYDIIIENPNFTEKEIVELLSEKLENKLFKEKLK